MMKYSSPFVEETFALFITIAFLYDGGREIDSNLQLAIVFMTLWICYQLSNFKETVFFKLKFRELISDYALPVGVLISSALTYAFRVNGKLCRFSFLIANKQNLTTMSELQMIYFT